MSGHTIVLDSTVVRPGTWLRLKSCTPNRLRHAVARFEKFLYGNRGVFVWLDDKAVRCAVDAAPVFLAHPDHAEDRLLMQQVFESLEPGDAFLDVGSHVGLYAIGAALRVGARGRVIAFEPTPATIAKMTRNIALNNLTDRIAIEEVAVSDKAGTVDFVTTGTSMMNSIFKGVPQGHTRPGGPERSITVRTAPLDQYFEAGRKTVAKIDPEGHEAAVLRGAPKLMASAARIFVELHPWAWESQDEVWAELLDMCCRTRREIRLLDGTLLTEPAHRRTEFARL